MVFFYVEIIKKILVHSYKKDSDFDVDKSMGFRYNGVASGVICIGDKYLARWGVGTSALFLCVHFLGHSSFSLQGRELERGVESNKADLEAKTQRGIAFYG